MAPTLASATGLAKAYSLSDRAYEIEPVNPPENQTQFAMAYYVINYSKLRIWEFVEYSKIIYLDGDIQVFGNIDHLFDLGNGHFHAVMDCFCERSWSNSPQYRIGYCQLCPEEMGPEPPFYFNAGMFIFEPNLSVYDHLLSTLVITPASTFAEQDYLNMFFKDTYKPITLTYNLGLPMLWRHPEHVDIERTKVVCYCAAVRFKAMEVYWAGGEHGEEGYKDVGEEVVGYIQ
ncbi:hypothetical protein AAG906_006230 [Vitis piasezkii]